MCNNREPQVDLTEEKNHRFNMQRINGTNKCEFSLIYYVFIPTSRSMSDFCEADVDLTYYVHFFLTH